QRDPIQRPLRPLDVHNELTEWVTSQPAVELRSLEQGECREYPVLHREYALSLTRFPFGAQPSDHQVEQGDASSGEDGERDERFEERDAAVTAEHRRALR